MLRALSALALTSLVAFSPRPASATYSIVAADTAERTTGGAATSCLGGEDVFIIFGSVAGKGTIHAQATFNANARSRGTELLAAGAAPDEIILALTAPTFDAAASLRQYGIADVLGRTATYTGADTTAYAGARRGAVGSLVYAAQGNILTSRAVIDQASDAFEAAGCDLPERLLRALEAGAEHGEGDHRCTAARGIPSDSAFVRVNGPSADEPLLDLHVPTSGDENPLVELRAEFDAWRGDHPCPSGVAGAGDGPDAGLAGSPNAPAGEAKSAGPGGDHGCGCDLPRGRTTARLACFPLGLALLLGRRRRARAAFSRNLSAGLRE